MEENRDGVQALDQSFSLVGVSFGGIKLKAFPSFCFVHDMVHFRAFGPKA